MDKLLFDNPILIKHIRARLRRPQATYLAIVVLSLCLCIMWAGWYGNGLDNGVIFSLMIFGVGAVLQLGGTSQVASSISQTNDSGILDFHRVSPLSAHTTTIGFVLGGPIREYMVAAIIWPFALFCAVLGDPGILGFASISIVMLTTTLLFHMMSMNAGILSKRGKTRGANMGLAFMIILASGSTASVTAGLPIPGLLTVGPAYAEAMGQLEGPRVQLPTFFGLGLPMFVQSLIYQLPVIVFLTIPVVRRMRSEQASLYSKPAAIACLAAISFLNLGGIVNHPKLQPEHFIPMLLYASVLVSLLLTMAVTPAQGSYMNLVRRSKKQNMLKPSLWLDESSNRAILFVFASFTWATVQVVDTFLAKGQLKSEFLIMTGTAVCVIVYFGSAAQFFALKYGRKSKAMLLMFLFFFWLMPLILAALVAATIDPDTGLAVAAFSPIYGIGSASMIGLVAAAALAGVFFALMVREERVIQEVYAGDPFEEEFDE
ncbi:MAG: hypothetical protein O2820_12695 [Planctomycetota bacterium]|nr:hypothetical protein [Planctomycetota bacterium]MDA1250070.1 hypothetical protein [Planctomycetota bacterium]